MMVAVSMLAVALAGCGGVVPKVLHTTHATASPTPNTQEITIQLETAIDQMVAADNAQIAGWNSGDPATVTSAINATIADHQALDTVITGITFPTGPDTTDAKSVLSADVAYENSLSELAANTSDVGTYNALYNAMVPLESSFSGALSVLAGDFGLVPSSPSPSPGS